MSGRNLFLTLTLALGFSALAAVPARAADTTIVSPKFTIRFVQGWELFDLSVIPGFPVREDSSRTVMNKDLEAQVKITPIKATHTPTEAELAAIAAGFPNDTGAVKTGTGTVTLGGKVWAWVEWADKDSTTDDKTRVRVYYGSLTPTVTIGAVFAYNRALGTTAVTQVEAALGTLAPGVAGIRTVAEWKRPAYRPADHDALGRMRPDAFRTALFRLPAL